MLLLDLLIRDQLSFSTDPMSIQTLRAPINSVLTNICTSYSDFTRVTGSLISVKIRPFWTKDLQFCWRRWRQTWVTLGSSETRVAISKVWAMFINFCSSFHSSNLAAKNVFLQWYMAVQVPGYECSSETLHTLESSSRAKGGGGGWGVWHTSKCSLIRFKLELSLVLKLLLHILNYLGQKYARSWNSSCIFTVNIAGFKKFLQRSIRHCPEYIMENKHKEVTLKHKDNHEICYKYNGHLGYENSNYRYKTSSPPPPPPAPKKSILRGFASLTDLNVDLLQIKYMAGRFSSGPNMHIVVHCWYIKWTNMCMFTSKLPFKSRKDKNEEK